MLLIVMIWYDDTCLVLCVVCCWYDVVLLLWRGNSVLFRIIRHDMVFQ
jgi:hypothetical protein